MRISSDAELAQAKFHFAASLAAETQSSGAAPRQFSGPALERPMFLAEGSVQAMRCARLLAFLMLEYEVPIIVRHAIRCAQIFFRGAVDFERLELGSPSSGVRPTAPSAGD